MKLEREANKIIIWWHSKGLHRLLVREGLVGSTFVEGVRLVWRDFCKYFVIRLQLQANEEVAGLSSWLATLMLEMSRTSNRLIPVSNYHNGSLIIKIFLQVWNYLAFHNLVQEMCDTLLILQVRSAKPSLDNQSIYKSYVDCWSVINIYFFLLFERTISGSTDQKCRFIYVELEYI